MNEKNLLKHIRLIEEQIKILNEEDMKDTIREELIKRNETVRKYYQLKLKELKWDLLLRMGRNEETISN